MEAAFWPHQKAASGPAASRPSMTHRKHETAAAEATTGPAPGRDSRP